MSNTNDAAAIFDALIASAATPEQADDRRLLKAYFTDPAARAAMQDEAWRLTNASKRKVRRA